MLKKWKLVSTLAVGAALLAACGEDEPDLVINSFTDELQDVIDVFNEEKDVNVQLQIIPTENYVDTIRPALESGSGAPDIFTAEIVYLLDWIEQDYWTNLSEDPYNVEEWSDEYIEYVFEAGRNEAGEIKAVSWQTTPGGIYYRRSIAEEVFGTDDPDEIGELFSSMDGLMDAGEQLREAGYRLFPDEGSVSPYTMGNNPQPWVDEDNNLVMTDERLSYFDYAKELRENQYTALAPAWSPAWYASFNEPIAYNVGWDELEDEDSGEGDGTTEVFGVSLPTWGLHSVLKEEATDTAGDWAVTAGPTPYFEGGTWIGIYEGSENKELAFEFIEMLVHDQDFMTDWANQTGDVLSHIDVMEDVSEEYSDEFLGGQNHYPFFLERANEINIDSVTRYDQQLNEFFGSAVGGYVDDEYTFEEALEEFYSEVQSAYPEINVPD